jgi:hypothetical protein
MLLLSVLYGVSVYVSVVLYKLSLYISVVLYRLSVYVSVKCVVQSVRMYLCSLCAIGLIITKIV